MLLQRPNPAGLSPAIELLAGSLQTSFQVCWTLRHHDDRACHRLRCAPSRRESSHRTVSPFRTTPARQLGASRRLSSRVRINHRLHGLDLTMDRRSATDVPLLIHRLTTTMHSKFPLLSNRNLNPAPRLSARLQHFEDTSHVSRLRYNTGTGSIQILSAIQIVSYQNGTRMPTRTASKSLTASVAGAAPAAPSISA